MSAGDEIVEDVSRGFDRLHSLGTCSGSVRWMADVPHTDNLSSYQLGPPSVTRGIIFVGTDHGYLIAIADPAVYPSAQSRCSHAGFSIADCVSNGHQIVRDPIVLLQLDLGRGSLIRNEPAIANDRIFLTTLGGWVVMVESELV